MTPMDEDLRKKAEDIFILIRNHPEWPHESVDSIFLIAEALQAIRDEENERCAKIAQDNNDRCECRTCNKRSNIVEAIRNSLGDGK